jgi:predicted amidohydrolase
MLGKTGTFGYNSGVAEIIVAAAQTSPQIGDTARNLKEISRVLELAANQGAHLVTFPECALTGYNYPNRAEALLQSESLPGPASRLLAALCRKLGVYTVFGLLERDGERLFNSAVLLGPAGLIGIYRKTHLPILGVDRFLDPGGGPLEVYSTPLGRVGILICYDSAFPECPRVLTLKGADIIVLPTNFPEGKAGRVIDHVLPTRALENHIYLVVANRVGCEGGTTFAGRSCVLDPHGTVIAAASPVSEEVIRTAVNPETAREKHIVVCPGEYETDYVGHRRPELYAELVASTRQG